MKSKNLQFLLWTSFALFMVTSCKKENGVGPASGKHTHSAAVKAYETLVDGSSLANYTAFQNKWSYNYPWGTDHNGSARMAASSTDHTYLWLSNNELSIKATRQSSSFGNSTANGFTHVALWYYSGACYLKSPIVINDQFPEYTIFTDAAVPTVRGTWPAFWITGISSWPPESDIMEFKGTSSVWQNSYDGGWENTITGVSNAGGYHNYKCYYKKRNATDVECHYYIDNVWKAMHILSNAVDKPMNLIINMQMEGDSGSPGPAGTTTYSLKNIYVGRVKNW